ncbi:MAG: helix-turn-helix transcriptional regulator [Lachnospiraceae bacterium]|nr:helix-turn-helix transcriptional regulator [Lachnospiraceae bacterium]
MTESEQKKVFANNLLDELRRSRKQQIDVAKAIGVSQQTFNTWCRGIALPRIGKIEKLAQYFHIQKSDLLDPHITPSHAATPFAPDEIALIRDYNKLNELGKEEARKRIAELAEIQKYTEDEFQKDAKVSG